jgi:hypothetical protein
LREHKGKIDENQRQLIGQVVDAVHDEAQAVSLITGNCLNNEDGAVDGDGSRDGLLVMCRGRYPQVGLLTYCSLSKQEIVASEMEICA